MWRLCKKFIWRHLIFFFSFPKAQKHAVPSRRWSRRSNVVWRCCSDPASSWSVALDSAKRRGDDTSVGGKSRQQSEHEKSLKDRETFTHTHEFISKLNDCRTESGRQTPDPRTDKRKLLYLEPLILQNLLDGHHLLAVDEASLVHHTERPVADHLQEKRKPSNEHQIIRWRADTDTCCRFELICVSPGVQITSVIILQFLFTFSVWTDAPCLK